MTAPEPKLDAFLIDAGLIARGDPAIWTPLTGGVSSDIWRVDANGKSWCVKRAVPQLRVAAEWKAPVERNATEWAYMQVVREIVPRHIAQPIAHDEERGLFAMAWLSPAKHRLWKNELLAGRVDPADAAKVGDILGRIHAGTASAPLLPTRFATDACFHALRIDAYLLATARVHSDLAPDIEAIAHQTAQTKRVLVHGDVSPKNIMLGPDGPILLDAECAWFGDPAFDVAFCLNHLIIKQLAVTASTKALAQSVDALISAYFAHINWESASHLEDRAASLLPILALARVDGKSPVEYLDDAQQHRLRKRARTAIRAQKDSLRVCAALLSTDS